MTFKETTAAKLFNELYQIIKEADTPEEQKAKIYYLLENRLDLNRAAVVANQPVTLKLDEYEQMISDVGKLKKGYPVQYVLGKTWFYGREFKVSPAVLIPRPETEELVHQIISVYKESACKILDVGTGTGCIPITLNLELPKTEIWAIDVDEGALEIARENADLLNTKVSFFHHDIFDDAEKLPNVDVLVSNPPYVPKSEQLEMQREVLMHEPHIALFVEDDDPLVFYRRIAEVGQEILLKNGRLYFEIHKDYGDGVKMLLKEKGYFNVKIVTDINNNDRIVEATK